MCGFYGCIGKDKKPNKSLEHRGPNQYGSYVDEKLSLHQWRLSILDLHKQELPWNNKNWWLLYNGEIYNYIELREELRKLGHIFKTTCDAEVVIEAFEEWGDKAVEKFIGMWAIVLIHKQTNIILVSRDIAGKKPLFFRFYNDYIEFASEIKTFDNLNYVETDSVKYWEFCLDNDTCFRNIYQIEAASIYTFVNNKLYSKRKYFDVDNIEINEKITQEEAIEEFDKLLNKSIELRKRSDVPIGQFLSGGLDSSLIYLKLLPDTVSYYDLWDNSHEIVKDLTIHRSQLSYVYFTDKESVQEVLPKICYHLEMPVGHLSVPIWWMLARSMKNKNVPVVYSGEGADELFNGYTRNEIVLYENDIWYKDFKFKGYEPIREKYLGTIFDRLTRLYIRHNDKKDIDWMHNRIESVWNSSKPLHWNLKKLEFTTCIQPLLQISDRMTMAHSIELRCPYLDKEIIKFAFSLPLDCTWQNNKGKYLVKQLFTNQAKSIIFNMQQFLEYNSKKTGMAIPYNWYSNNIVDRSDWNNLLKQHIKEQLE